MTKQANGALMIIEVDGRLIGLEKARGAEIVYISHAHSDHIVNTKKEILSSKETFDLINSRSNNKNRNNNGDNRIKENLNNVSLFPAGHMLGSTQIKIENKFGEKIVYTGDFKLRDGFTTKGADILKCDTLMIDSTFGDPDFLFPEKEEIAEDISKWIKRSLEEGVAVLGAYSLGKAQELIRLINEYTGIAPIVDSSIETGCKVYEKYGIKLERISLESPEGSDLFKNPEGSNLFKKNFVSILPFHKVDFELYKKLRKTYKAVFCGLATGWAIKYRYGMEAFPLSDHADFNEILTYVSQSNAKKIICKDGNASRLAYELRRKGYNATTDYKEKSVLDLSLLA